MAGLPPVPDCSRALAFAIVASAPLLITQVGESISPPALAFGLFAGTIAAAPFVGSAVVLALLGSRR